MGLEKVARVLVMVNSEKFHNRGLSDLWAVHRDTLEDGHQMLLENHQLSERHSLFCPKCAGLPEQKDVRQGMFLIGPFQIALHVAASLPRGTIVLGPSAERH